MTLYRLKVIKHADFTYSISAPVITTVDLNLGNRSVTNDIQYVLRQIEQYHQGPICGWKIMYRDSQGIWDGIHWDGKDAACFSLNETDENRARKKFCSE